MRPAFVHLHLHTEYSLANGTVRIPSLVRKTAEQGMPAVAVTEPPLPVTVEITPLPVETFPTVPVLPDSNLSPETASQPQAGENRRVRSRSRVASPAAVSISGEPAGAVAVAELPVAEVVPDEAAVDDSGEPRRRRRRSSAAE